MAELAEKDGTGQVHARPAMAAQCGAWSGRTGPGRVQQSSTRQDQASSGRTGQSHEGSVSAGQVWAKPNRAWYGQQNWTEAARRAVLDSEEPCRIGQGQFGYG